MPSQFFVGRYGHRTSNASITDLTAPTFAGIAALIVGSRGQLRASWAAATEAVSNPVRYEVYVKAATATDLFMGANIIGITDKLQLDFWQTPDGAFLVNGTTYYVGVRAVDAVGNRDGNIVSSSVISTGVFTSANIYKPEGVFVINSANQLQGTMWILKDSVLGLTNLGTAAFQVYDKAGNAVPGMGGSGIAADSEGQFKITPVSAAALSDQLEHYVVKMTITMDSAARSGYAPLIEPPPAYDVNGVFGLNTSNQLVASFWVTANEQVIPSGARLGTASYQVYDRTGAAVSGMAGSGISADAQGLFKITPVNSSLLADLGFYTVKVSVTVDGIVRSDFLPIMGKVPAYECFATVSVNGANQLQLTIHCETDGQVKKGSGLGTASYQIFDSAGVAVSGLNQSGIAADSNGRFIATPVSAALLLDLTHYTMTIKVIADGIERESIMGFSRLGT